MSSPIPTFKIALIGSGGVGKTTYTKKIRVGEFERKYIPTLGVDVHPLTFNLTLEDKTEPMTVTLNFWDTAGQEKYLGLDDGYYIEAKAALMMYDLTSRLSYKLLASKIEAYRNVAPGTPIVFCGNKLDCRASLKVSMDKRGHHYISTKTGQNMMEPLKDIMSQLLECKVLDMAKI